MDRKILVINLTRFGDLLETQPLLSGLAASGWRSGLVCLENFVTAAPMMRGLEDVWPLPSSGILSTLEHSWPKALRKILNFASVARHEGKYDYILNLTLSNPARLLTRMLAADGARTLGFDMDNEGFGKYSGSWAGLFAATTAARSGSPFNVADLFRMMALPLLDGLKPAEDAGLLNPPDENARIWARQWLAKFPQVASGNLVGFQLGASNSARQWPVENFVALGRELARKGYYPLLLGSSAEKSLGREFAAMADYAHIDAIGQTDIPQLGALLENCKLLVTNDTGTMHFASGQAVPILAFFLATAQPWDTGPYSSGNCCLEPAIDCHPCFFNDYCTQGNKCLDKIAPEYAASLALAFLESGDWTGGVTDAMRKNVRVWLTTRDECGFASLISLSGHEKENRGAWLAWQRWFWRQMLDDLAGYPDACSIAAPLSPLSPEYRARVASALLTASKAMDSLTGAAALVGKSPRAGKILLDGCEKIQKIFDLCQPLHVFSIFWKQMWNDNANIAFFGKDLAIMAANIKNFAVRLDACA